MSENYIQRSSLQLEVMQRLRTEIIDGVWAPGMRLQERLLCERYGISRSPLREAFQTLAAENLIEISINKGAVVTAPTASLALQNFDLLRALELLAVRKTCEQATSSQVKGIAEADDHMKDAARIDDKVAFARWNIKVHRRIVLACGNQPLAEAHLLASRQLIRIQNLSGRYEHVTTESVDEHDEIIAAIEKRDAETAVRLHSAHLDTVGENLRARLSEWDTGELAV